MILSIRRNLIFFFKLPTLKFLYSMLSPTITTSIERGINLSQNFQFTKENTIEEKNFDSKVVAEEMWKWGADYFRDTNPNQRNISHYVEKMIEMFTMYQEVDASIFPTIANFDLIGISAAFSSHQLQLQMNSPPYYHIVFQCDTTYVTLTFEFSGDQIPNLE